MNPLVTVIMGVHQHNPFLNDAIQSILNQTFADFEFMIIANNCDDKLIEYLEAFKDSRIRMYRTSIGQLSFNLNFALNLSKSELIMRMDADDISHVDRIGTQYKLFNECPLLTVLGTSYEVIDSEGRVLSIKKQPSTNFEIRSQIFYSNPFCHPSVMFRKSEILKVGGYLGGKFCEDYGLWLRLCRNDKIEFRNLEKPLLKYRIHPDQTKGHRLGYAEAAGLVMTEFLLKPDLKKFLGIFLSSMKILKAK